MPIGKERARYIQGLVDDKGIEWAMQETRLKRETIRRALRTGRESGADPVDSLPANKTLQKLAEVYSPDELRALLKDKAQHHDSHRRTKYDFSGEWVKFGVLSDLHIGSSYTDEHEAELAIAECARQGCEMLLIPGDLTEGMSGRDGHVYELKHIGYRAQRAAAIRVLSKFPGKIKAISGNHDLWYMSKGNQGALIVEDICRALPDAEYLGEHEGSVYFNGARVDLWHGEDGSCFDDKTEIQTKAGWKLFKDLKINDEVATMTKESHEFQWQKPIDIFKKEYHGDMIHFKSRTIDCMVTPNHGMWTRASSAVTYRRKSDLIMRQKSHIRLNTEWHRKDAGDIYKEYGRQKWQFTKVCDSWEGKTPDTINVPHRESKNIGKKVFHFGNVPVEDMAELIAWYVTEGHTTAKTVTISQYQSVNPIYHAQIIDLAKRLGANYGISKKSITIHSVELSEFLKSMCGHMSRYKYLPAWLKNCTSDILELVLQTMISGDGWDATTKGSYGYRSISPRLLSDFAEIAIKLGYAVNFCPDGETVGIYKTQTTPTVNTLPEIMRYDGNIYCCEVPNGLINVRRNGKTLWTHNSYALSYRLQKIVESIEGGTKPNMIIAGHDHKSLYLPNLRNIQALAAGCIQHQTPWMRRKKLAAYCGFWIVELCIRDGKIIKVRPEWTMLYFPDSDLVDERGLE